MNNHPPADAPLRVAEATSFLRDDLLGPLLRQRAVAAQFKLDGNAEISSKQWEIFAAVLLGRNGSSRAGDTDLEGVEVKSAKVGGSFEYQYHRHIGAAKLAGDAHAAHLFVSYAQGYTDLKVYLLRADQIHDAILAWKPRLEAAYGPAGSRQRCRVSLAYTFVRDHGTLILEVADGGPQFAASGTVADLLGAPTCSPSCRAV
jgi:hypothetical protein